MNKEAVKKQLTAKDINQGEWYKDSNVEGEVVATDIVRNQIQILKKGGGYTLVSLKEDTDEKKEDMVNNPNHYNTGRVEVIDIIEDATRDARNGFEGSLQGNIIKYILRYRHKNGLEDLKKTKWYLKKLITEVESIEQGTAEKMK